MQDELPSAISHVSIGTNDFPRAVAFYDSVLATLGIGRVFSPEGIAAVAYGRKYPEFWVQSPIDGAQATTGNGIHFAFLAPSKQSVQDFWTQALAMGASADGEPGPRPHYGEPYFGCFVRDPDGHKIEANYWDFELAAKLGLAG